MKLPRIAPVAGMQRLEKVDPSVFVGVARARMMAAGAISEAFDQAADVGIEYAAREQREKRQAEARAERERLKAEKEAAKMQAKYRERENKLQSSKALGDYLMNSRRYAAQYEGQVKIPGSGIPAEVQSQLGTQYTGEQMVARHEIMPEIMLHGRTEALKKAAEQIEDPNKREEFLINQQADIMALYGKDIQDAMKAQIVESRRQVGEYVNEFMRNKQYTDATQMVKSAGLPKKEEDKLLDDIIRTKQTQQIVDAISMADNDPNKEATLDFFISKLNEDDAAFTSHIQAKKATLLSNLDSAKTKFAAADAQQLRMSWRITKDNITTSLNNIEKNGDGIPEDFDRWYNEAVQKVQVDQDPEALLLIKKMDEARQIAGMLPAIMNAEPRNRENIARNLINQISTEDVHKSAYYHNVIEPKIRAAEEQQKQDPVKYLRTWNARARGVERPNFDDPTSVRRYVVQMQPFEKQIAAQTGKQGVIFSDSEFDELNQKLSDPVVGAEQKYSLLGTIMTALSTEQQRYGFTQALGEQGTAAPLVIGAQLLGKEQEASAMSVIRGYDYMQDPAKRVTKDVSDKMVDKFADDLGAFMITSPYQDQFKQAITATYHDLLVSSHGDVSKFDPDIYEQASDTVLGGPLMELGDRKLFPFRRGQSTKEAKNLLKDVHPDTYRNIELQSGVTHTQILRNVIRGEWKLNSIAPNQYYVEVENGYTMTRIKNVVGTDYVFTIPENYDSKKAYEYFLDLPPGVYEHDITTLQGMERAKKKRTEKEYVEGVGERGEMLQERSNELLDVESFVQQVSGKGGL